MLGLVDPSRPGYLRIVRTSAWYDLVVTAGFATPWTYAWLHAAMTAIGDGLGWGAPPALDPVQTLFANLMGSVVVVWALLRIRRPIPEHGRYDGAARVLFALWQAYALAHGAFGLVWFFLVVEVGFGAAQLLPWLGRARRDRADERHAAA